MPRNSNTGQEIAPLIGPHEIAYSGGGERMATEGTPRWMTQAEYSRHRRVSKPYITKLAKNGVLVMRNGKVDVHASDTVLDDKPVDDVDAPPAGAPSSATGADRPADAPLTQSGASFGQARTIEMVFRAKLRRLEFETKQGKLIEAEVYRKTAANAFRAFRDGLLGLPDRLATVLAAESDPKKVHVTLKTEISRELEAAADAILAL